MELAFAGIVTVTGLLTCYEVLAAALVTDTAEGDVLHGRRRRLHRRDRHRELGRRTRILVALDNIDIADRDHRRARRERIRVGVDLLRGFRKVLHGDGVTA